MIRFYYTGAKGFLKQNQVPSLSTGGWISKTLVRANNPYGLFDNILTRENRTQNPRYRILAIQNQYPYDLQDIKLFIAYSYKPEDRFQDIILEEEGRTHKDKINDFFTIKAVAVAPTEQETDTVARAIQSKRPNSPMKTQGLSFDVSDSETVNLYGEHVEIPVFGETSYEEAPAFIPSLPQKAYFGISFEITLNMSSINRIKKDAELEAEFSNPLIDPFDSKYCNLRFCVEARKIISNKNP